MALVLVHSWTVGRPAVASNYFPGFEIIEFSLPSAHRRPLGPGADFRFHYVCVGMLYSLAKRADPTSQEEEMLSGLLCCASQEPDAMK